MGEGLPSPPSAPRCCSPIGICGWPREEVLDATDSLDSLFPKRGKMRWEGQRPLRSLCSLQALKLITKALERTSTEQTQCFESLKATQSARAPKSNSFKALRKLRERLFVMAPKKRDSSTPQVSPTMSCRGRAAQARRTSASASTWADVDLLSYFLKAKSSNSTIDLDAELPSFQPKAKAKGAAKPGASGLLVMALRPKAKSGPLKAGGVARQNAYGRWVATSMIKYIYNS